MRNNNRIEVDISLLFTLIFAALRMDGCITWPWFVVLSPIIAANLIKLIMIIVILIRKKWGGEHDIG